MKRKQSLPSYATILEKTWKTCNVHGEERGIRDITLMVESFLKTVLWKVKIYKGRFQFLLVKSTFCFVIQNHWHKLQATINSTAKWCFFFHLFILYVSYLPESTVIFRSRKKKLNSRIIFRSNNHENNTIALSSWNGFFLNIFSVT